MHRPMSPNILQSNENISTQLFLLNKTLFGLKASCGMQVDIHVHKYKTFDCFTSSRDETSLKKERLLFD